MIDNNQWIPSSIGCSCHDYLSGNSLSMHSLSLPGVMQTERLQLSCYWWITAPQEDHYHRSNTLQYSWINSLYQHPNIQLLAPEPSIASLSVNISLLFLYFYLFISVSIFLHSYLECPAIIELIGSHLTNPHKHFLTHPKINCSHYRLPLWMDSQSNLIMKSFNAHVCLALNEGIFGNI